MQTLLNFKMACKNKLKKIDYKESSISITDSRLVTFNLPSFQNFTKNSKWALAIPIPKVYIITLSHNITTNFYIWILM